MNIHTFNARDNTLFPAVYELSGKDPAKFRSMVLREIEGLDARLRESGVEYSELKSALIPSGGRQVVFFYDWLGMTSNYAVAFAEGYLPLLGGELTTSVLAGDTHFREISQGAARFYAEGLIQPAAREVNWDTQYAVYFSNLSQQDADRIHLGLSKLSRYTGYVDVTHAGAARDGVAVSLPPRWVIRKGVIVSNHGPDGEPVDAIDLIGFEVSRFGFRMVSVVDHLYLGFLSYKVETDVFPWASGDREMTLAVAAGQSIAESDLSVHVPRDKLDKYLLSNPDKLLRMTEAGLADVTPEELSTIIKDKVQGTYIYGLKEASDGTPLFAVSAEFTSLDGGVTRRLIALKYDRANQRISLTTMY